MRNPAPRPEPDEVSGLLKYCIHFEVRADADLLRRAINVIDQLWKENKELKDAKEEKKTI